ncbi:hypothetical protein FHL15_003821 [Xylaria flabelliformis]|uniref:Uncharacterized protein n=1 Tax=Xylaria flabelliformis TaxID=2512241 RepID=A0A553I4J5_9PEZI|nr:hypothetical protein FHL15_003821 [Xylaria flabelliformis]
MDEGVKNADVWGFHGHRFGPIGRHRPLSEILTLEWTSSQKSSSSHRVARPNSRSSPIRDETADQTIGDRRDLVYAPPLNSIAAACKARRHEISSI